MTLARRAALATLATAALPPPARASVTATDALGRRLTLSAPPSRIVSLNGSAEAQLVALGARPVGTNLIHRSYLARMGWLLGDGPPVPGVVNADWTPDAEAILALAPDLVIAWSAEQAETLGRHLPVFAMRTLRSVADLRDNLDTLGRILGRVPQAAQAIAGFDRRLAAYARAAPAPLSVTTVSVTGNRRFFMPPADSLLAEVLGNIADTARAAPASRLGWVEGGIETLHRLDPDAIVLVYWNLEPRDDVSAMLGNDRLWRALRAVWAGRVIPVNGYEAVTFQSIPTTTRLIDTVAPRLYPEIFPTALGEDRIAAILGG
jgi:ABC-type Fe3+-hydroxamate transport system substrate-binding protein